MNPGNKKVLGLKKLEPGISFEALKSRFSLGVWFVLSLDICLSAFKSKQK